MPEKALLDWIYLNRQEGLPTPVDELNIQFLNRQRLKEFAVVQKIVKEILVNQMVAA